MSNSLEPTDCNLPGSSVHGIFQARILEWDYRFLLQGIFLTQGSNSHLLHHLYIGRPIDNTAPPGKPNERIIFTCKSLGVPDYLLGINSVEAFLVSRLKPLSGFDINLPATALAQEPSSPTHTVSIGSHLSFLLPLLPTPTHCHSSQSLFGKHQADCITSAEDSTGLPLRVTHLPHLQLTPHCVLLICCVLPSLFSVHQRSLPPQDLCICCFLRWDHFPSFCGSLLPTIHDSAHSPLFGKIFIDLPHLLPGSLLVFFKALHNL